jgi:calcineurin-like phosphoesterase family protein
MRVTWISTEPLAELPYLNAGRRKGEILEDRLPVFDALVDRLPSGLDALVATADLQFRERPNGKHHNGLRLLGETAPGWLSEEILPQLGVNDPERVGALLCGDFYTVPALDKRGGIGDVTDVWRCFREAFGWTAGVAGNHDSFGPEAAPRPRFSPQRGYFFLDEDVAETAGLRVAGVGGVIGDPKRLQRRCEEDYLNAFAAVLDHRPDVLLCHDGPEGAERGQAGSPTVREIVEVYPPGLIVRGHAHWSNPLATLANGAQVLNVDSRVIILRPAPKHE